MKIRKPAAMCTLNVLRRTITARDRRAQEKANTTNIAIMNILVDGMGVAYISLSLKLLNEEEKKRQGCLQVHRRRKHGRKKPHINSEKW